MMANVKVCDLCGTQGTLQYADRCVKSERLGATPDTRRYRVGVECTQNDKTFAAAGDERWDICPRCLIAQLERLADQIAAIYHLTRERRAP